MHFLLKKYNLNWLNGDFRDGISLGYCWEPNICLQNMLVDISKSDMPCMVQDVDSSTFDTIHEFCDVFADVLDEIRFNVDNVPKLQRLQGETVLLKTTGNYDTRLDIKVNRIEIQSHLFGRAKVRSACQKLSETYKKSV